jgi:hypothetical protein
MVLVIMLLSLVVVDLGQVAKRAQTYTAEQEEQDSRRLRFGDRETQLRELLESDNIILKNVELKNNLARIEGTPEDLTRIEIDRFLVAQDEIATKVTNLLARVWYRSGNKELQPKLFDIEKQLFDEAYKECNPLLRKGSVYSNLEDAKNNCADLGQIYETVGQYKIKGEPVPSFFTEIGSSPKTYAKWLRDDIMQLKKDTAITIPAKIEIRNEKEKLILRDEIIIEGDEVLWNSELRNEMVTKHNQAHPDDLFSEDKSSGIEEALIGVRQATINEAEAIRKIIKAETRLSKLSR